MLSSLFSQFLLSDLLLHFDIVDFQELGDISTKKDCIHIYLDEKNELPTGYNLSDYESKGFYERNQCQDFPILGKAVYLGIKRKRWRSKVDKSIEIRSDYFFIIEGSKLTIELSDLSKIPVEQRQIVKEITLDMANNMQLASRMVFPEASIVIDRFHVVKLVLEALQHLRIQYRWEAIEKENQAIKLAKEQGVKYVSITFDNDDTPRQLLARSRYIIARKESEWTENQKQRALLLFENYPLLRQAYIHTMEFRNIYELTSKEEGRQKILKWISKTKLLQMTVFNTVANSLNYHLETIINFFNNISTNANAESFNSKIKLFRANQRGVIDVKFFLFRIEKLFS